MTATMLSTIPTEVTVEQYAGIVAALNEGHDLDAVLAQEQVSPNNWDAVDTDFKDRLSQDAALLTGYSSCLIEAEDQLDREVTPLKQDPGAYLAFIAQFSSAGAGPELAAQGLNVADIGRLGRHWQGRFAGDTPLRKRAVKAAERMAAPTDIRVAPAELRPFRWTRASAAAELPPQGAGAPTDPLSSTIDPSQLPSAYAPAASRPKRTVLAPTPALGSTAPLSGHIAAGPALPFRGKVQAPAPQASSLEPHPQLGGTAAGPIAEGRPAEGRTPIHTRQRQQPREPLRKLEPSLALGETARDSTSPKGPAVPFRGTRSAPQRTRLEPHPELGGTASMQGNRKTGCATPFHHLEPTAPLRETAPKKTAPSAATRPRKRLEPLASLGETAPLGAETPVVALPFEGQRPAPRRLSLEPHPQLGGTAPVERKTRAKAEGTSELPTTDAATPSEQADEDPHPG